MEFKSKTIEEFYEKYNDSKDIDHVVDFLNNEYPHKKRFNFSYEQALEKANNWTEELNNRKIEDINAGEVDFILDLGNGFSLVRLVDQCSKDWEGYHMGHCVASYKSHQGIYSIRRDDIPVCTLEVGKQIKQVKGRANGKISPKYIDYVIKAVNYFNCDLDEDMIQHLGYEELVEVDEKIIKTYFKNYEFKKINNENYLYTGNQLKLVKPFKEKSKNLFRFFCMNNNCLDTVKFLIEKGDSDKICNDLSLMLASENGHLEVVKVLVKSGIHDFDGAALSLAKQNGHADVVNFLVENISENGHLEVFLKEFVKISACFLGLLLLIDILFLS